MVTAYRKKKDFERQEWQYKSNTEAWMCGVYVMRAVGSCLSSNNKYPQHPLPMFPDDLKAQNDDGKPTMTPEEINVRNTVERARMAIEAIQKTKAKKGSRPT
jgi:hypothetical protein